MCDTMVVLPPLTEAGATIFAKNSDREPNEPNVPVRITGRKHYPGQSVKCTYISIEQASTTYDVFLIKPAWTWGAEMGVNEYAVAAGNEALFCRSKPNQPALIGMDLVRLALERSRSSREALEVIITLLERYGQGGNCGYQKTLHYHNSFLVADPSSAWLLETAGKYWAAKQVSSYLTISNAFTLRDDYQTSSAGITGQSRHGRSDFKKIWEHPLITRIVRGEHRRRMSEKAILGAQGPLTPTKLMAILRDHSPDDRKRLFRYRTLNSLCMHAGGPFSAQTTGSLVVELKPHQINAWFTGSSLPCLSLFKLFRFTLSPRVLGLNQKLPVDGEQLWWKREHFHRLILGQREKNLDRFFVARNKLETEIIERSFQASGGNETEILLRDALKREEELIDATAADWQCSPPSRSGSLLFKFYWARQNRLMCR